MGDWSGSDQSGRYPTQKGNVGCGEGGKTKSQVVRAKRHSKKRVYLFNGEVFFSLDAPFNG